MAIIAEVRTLALSPRNMNDRGIFGADYLFLSAAYASGPGQIYPEKKLIRGVRLKSTKL